MYKSFSLDVDATIFCVRNKCLNSISEDFNLKRLSNAHKVLDRALSDSLINSNDISAAWFPLMKADIFLSHSSKDKKLAQYIATWFKLVAGLDVFVDSSVWGYSEILQKRIDNHLLSRTPSNGFPYSERNKTTAHINTILTMAITKMIDNTEIFLFLNTENSTGTKQNITEINTYSPWIFYELSIAKLIARKKPERPRLIREGLTKTATASQKKILYYPPSDHLINISYPGLLRWGRNCYGQKWPEKNLSKFYSTFK